MSIALFALLLLVALAVGVALLVGRGKSVGAKLLAGTVVFWSVLMVGGGLLFIGFWGRAPHRQIQTHTDSRLEPGVPRQIFDSDENHVAPSHGENHFAPSHAEHVSARGVPRGWVFAGVLMLVLVAGVLVASALAAGKGPVLTARGMASGALSLLWAVPVIAVLGYLGAKIVPTLRDGGPPESVDYVKYPEPAAPLPAEAPLATEAFVERVNKLVTPAAKLSQPAGDEPLPQWVTNPALPPEGTDRVVLSTRQWSTIAEANAELEQMAAAKIKEDFQRHYPDKGKWELPARFSDPLNRTIFSDRHVQRVKIQAGANSFPVVKVYAQLDLQPDVRDEIHTVWRQQIAERRLWAVGGLVGLATLITASLAGYFRLDAATNGGYRRRLKLATLSLIVAGGLAAASVLPIG